LPLNFAQQKQEQAFALWLSEARKLQNCKIVNKIKLRAHCKIARKNCKNVTLCMFAVKLCSTKTRTGICSMV
jgi:hypothetical protein